MRILTRLIRKDKSNSGKYFLRDFIEGNLEKILRIEVEELEEKVLKDLLIFFCSYYELIPLADQRLSLLLGRGIRSFKGRFLQASHE